jgi:hypothetical protein
MKSRASAMFAVDADTGGSLSHGSISQGSPGIDPAETLCLRRVSAVSAFADKWVLVIHNMFMFDRPRESIRTQEEWKLNDNQS